MSSQWMSGMEIGVSAAAALGLAAGGFAYAARWPASQIFGRTLIAPRRAGEIALTFDDGPNPEWTPRLLELLASRGVKATFFLVGKYAAAAQPLVRRMVEEGHSIGNHSWSHPDLALTGKNRVLEELARTRETLEQASGRAVRLFRPGFGSRRPRVLRVARELGLTPVMWNAMTSDWSLKDSARIAENLAEKITGLERRGWAANVVLHDGGHTGPGADRSASVQAAGILADRFGRTHRFVTVEEWL